MDRTQGLNARRGKMDSADSSSSHRKTSDCSFEEGSCIPLGRISAVVVGIRNSHLLELKEISALVDHPSCSSYWVSWNASD